MSARDELQGIWSSAIKSACPVGISGRINYKTAQQIPPEVRDSVSLSDKLSLAGHRPVGKRYFHKPFPFAALDKEPSMHPIEPVGQKAMYAVFSQLVGSQNCRDKATRSTEVPGGIGKEPRQPVFMCFVPQCAAWCRIRWMVKDSSVCKYLWAQVQ